MVELEWISYGFDPKLSCLFALIIVISLVGGLIYFLQRVCNLLELLELNLGCNYFIREEEVKNYKGKLIVYLLYCLFRSVV